MSTIELQSQPPLTIATLEAALRAAEPAVVFLQPWVLQNIILHGLPMRGRPYWAPDPILHVIGRERVLEIVERQDLPLDDDPPNETILILTERPEVDVPQSEPSGKVLQRYWRRLFRGRLEAQVQHRLSVDGDGAIDRRVARIDAAVFNDARFVLQQERFIGASASDAQAYAKFAGVFLDLHHFAPHLLPYFFPSVTDPSALAARLEEDTDAAAWLHRTRPAGAEMPGVEAAQDDDDLERDAADAPVHRPEDSRASDRYERRAQSSARREALLAKARTAEAAGNAVRAALLHMQARRNGGAAGAARRLPSRATANLKAMVERLQAALGFGDDDAAGWRRALRPLLARAAEGWWSAEGRLLYDLQNVCIDHEREVYSVNVVEWILEWGRRPLRRPLPARRVVLMCKRLHSAHKRIAHCRLTPTERSRLHVALRDAAHRAAHHVRQEFRPAIHHSLAAAGLTPVSAVERVAEKKLTEELLDVIISYSYLTLGHLRDTLSRNQLKCNDLAGARDILHYDQLLRVDRELGDSLDGVYRRGEIYRQFFQKLSALLFANAPGRFLTRTLILPVAGAYLLLEALDHTVGLVIHKLGGPHWHWAHERNVAALAVVLFAIINWPAFRAAVGRVALAALRGLVAVLIDFPRWVASRPLVVAIAESRAARSTLRYGLKPLAFVAVGWALVPSHVSLSIRVLVLAAIFLAVNFLLNSHYGRAIEQSVLHALRTGWWRLTVEVVGEIIRAVVRFFQRLLETIDRMLYAVDEWLRFRTGQGRSTFVLKAVTGVAWFYIAYLVRFCVTLLVEPQINPVKHFPIVTVSHKLLVPQIKNLADALRQLGMRKAEATTLSGVIIAGVPGIFGFLGWELMSNWKLYRANRPALLRPVQFGAHGESLAQMLRPGLHSGTLPKAYRRLRKVHRPELDGCPIRADAEASDEQHAEGVEHVREAISRFIERELVELLNRHPAFAEAAVSMSRLTLGATRIRFELACAAVSAGPEVSISIEHRGGWIVAGIDRSGWIDRLTARQTELLASALLGFYKMSGADFVREQIESLFAPRAIRYDFRGRDMVVRPVDQPDVEAAYAIGEGRLTPRFVKGDADPSLPALESHGLLLGQAPFSWREWVRVWEPAEGEQASHAAESATRFNTLRSMGRPVGATPVTPQPAS